MVIHQTNDISITCDRSRRYSWGFNEIVKLPTEACGFRKKHICKIVFYFHENGNKKLFWEKLNASYKQTEPELVATATATTVARGVAKDALYASTHDDVVIQP